MFGWPLGHAAIAAAGGVLAFSSAVQPVSTPHPGNAASTWWRVAATFGAKHGQADLTSISAPSAQDTWVAGFTVRSTGFGVSALIKHWTGQAWQAVALPAGVARTWNNASPILAQIGASSPANVWVLNGILSGLPRYLRFDGKHWSSGTLPGAAGNGRQVVLITSAKVFSPTDVWAFGMIQRFSPQGWQSPYAAHFNGKSWAIVPVPGQGAITSVSAISPDDFWAVIGCVTTQRIATFAKPAVLQWTGRSGWRAAPVQPRLPAGAGLSSVVAERGGALWVGGETPNSADGTTPLSAIWNKKAWIVSQLPITASWDRWGLAELAATGGGVWGVTAAENVTSHQLWHLIGTRWFQVSPGFGWHAWQLGGLAAIPGTSSIWAAGMIRYRGTVNAIVALKGTSASVLPVHPAKHSTSKSVKRATPVKRTQHR
jgi:hypothetical protein